PCRAATERSPEKRLPRRGGCRSHADKRRGPSPRADGREPRTPPRPAQRGRLPIVGRRCGAGPAAARPRTPVQSPFSRVALARRVLVGFASIYIGAGGVKPYGFFLVRKSST